MLRVFMLSVFMLSVFMLSVFMLSVFMLSVFMLSFFMLLVFRLSLFMLSVIASPNKLEYLPMACFKGTLMCAKMALAFPVVSHTPLAMCHCAECHN